MKIRERGYVTITGTHEKGAPDATREGYLLLKEKGRDKRPISASSVESIRRKRILPKDFSTGKARSVWGTLEDTRSQPS